MTAGDGPIAAVESGPAVRRVTRNRTIRNRAIDRACTVLFDGQTGDQQAETWEYGVRCPGDLDNNGSVSLSDLAQLLGDFGCTSGLDACPGGADDDGDTDFADLTALLSRFGAVCP